MPSSASKFSYYRHLKKDKYKKADLPRKFLSLGPLGMEGSSEKHDMNNLVIVTWRSSSFTGSSLKRDRSKMTSLGSADSCIAGGGEELMLASSLAIFAYFSRGSTGFPNKSR